VLLGYTFRCLRPWPAIHGTTVSWWLWKIYERSPMHKPNLIMRTENKISLNRLENKNTVKFWNECQQLFTPWHPILSALGWKEEYKRWRIPPFKAQNNCFFEVWRWEVMDWKLCTHLIQWRRTQSLKRAVLKTQKRTAGGKTVSTKECARVLYKFPH